MTVTTARNTRALDLLAIGTDKTAVDCSAAAVDCTESVGVVAQNNSASDHLHSTADGPPGIPLAVSLRQDFPPEVDICNSPGCPSPRKDTATAAAVDGQSADASESENNIEYSATEGPANSDTAAAAAAVPTGDYNCDCP